MRDPCVQTTNTDPAGTIVVAGGKPLLTVRGLRTSFPLDRGVLKAVDGVDFDIACGETAALIGESGSGKSMFAHSLLQVLPKPGRIDGGAIILHRPGAPPTDIAALPRNSREMRAIRGKSIAMVFQEPMTSLSPVHTIGNQIVEAVLLHDTSDRRRARAIAIAMLEKVGISNAPLRFRAYPHQLSGGMRQRAMIAMALVCRPALLIADEPTTALDVTVQAQITELIRELQAEIGMSVLYITHDLGVVAGIADRVSVMYLGRIVESAPTRELLENPLHPYTVGLLKAVPRLGKASGVRLEAIPGVVPQPIDLPCQCSFRPRCPAARSGVCDRAVPAMHEASPGHRVRCFLWSDDAEGAPHG